MPKYSLTYFNMEGIAEKVRLAFKLAGVEFEDVRIEYQDWPAFKDKTPAGSVPFLTIDGGERITQSKAILRYIGAQYGLAPDPKDVLRGEVIFGIVDDLGRALIPFFALSLRPSVIGQEDRTTEQLTAISVKLAADYANESSNVFRSFEYLDKLLAENPSGFAVGDKPTIVDCDLFATLRLFRSGRWCQLPEGFLDRFQAIKKFEATFSVVPTIAAHYSSQ